MKLNQEITVALPDWLKHNTGKITKIIQTPTENYYVVEFPGGEMYTYKESDLTPTNDNFKRIEALIPYNCNDDFLRGRSVGRVDTLLEYEYITEEEYETLNALIYSRCTKKGR